MTAEQPRRDAHRECPVSSCCAPWTGQCLVAVRWWSSPASRPRNGGVECPIRNAKTRKDSREEGSRGAREPGNAPRGQGLDAELHGGAWYRGPVASVRSAARTAGRATGSGPSTTTFSVSCLMTASPRFRDAAGDGTDERKRPARTSVSDFRCRIGRSRCKSAGARLLSVSHPGPVPFGYPWGTSPEAGCLSRWAARRACRTPGRAAPRPPRGRRRDSASPGSRRSARPSDSPRRGARRWSSGRASSARRGETPISSVRAAKAKAKATRPERRGLPSGRPRGTPRTTSNDV